MGKQWYRGGRSSKRGEGVGDVENPSGCMCAFFQFFDYHPLHHFPVQQQQTSLKPPSSISEDHQSIPKGAEAPRNSLQSEDGTMSSISREEDFKIPKNIQIKTTKKGGNGNDLSSEISSSPSTKTPTLVARLMGLDLLPDAQSPSLSSSSFSLSCLSTPNLKGNSGLDNLRPKQHILTKPRKSIDNYIAGSRSLPETPRISSARRSDVDHRLSLQINKENMGLGEDLELPRFSFSKRKNEENSCRSPSHYARQIVKQVKESVSRKVGLDITNTVKNREQSREELVGQFRVKKSPKASLKVIDESSPGKYSNPSWSSPRLRFMEAKQHKPSTTTPPPFTPKDQNSHSENLPSSPTINIQPQVSRVLTNSKPQALPKEELQKQKSVPKCKKVANEKFSPRLKNHPQTSNIVRNKQEESFVRSPSPTKANDIKSKSKRIDINLLNVTTVPNLLPIKTDSSPATKIPHQQESDAQESKRSSQLSSCSRQKYKQEAKHILVTRESNDEEDDKPNGASTTTTTTTTRSLGPPEFEYVTDISSRTGATEEGTTTTVPLNNHPKWLSSIFHHLEHNYPTSVVSIDSSADNNHLHYLLLYDLVNEILGEILKPWVIQNSGSNSKSMAEAVGERIRRFPHANCEVLEDIDGLIEKEDLGKMTREGLDWREGGIVEEIEGFILETLVHEAIVLCGAV
ncbi:serine/arginine repetitive matrix protein 1 [Senna tora]|uniref:Serine/arginine repetitive matrix protein 1 n=1 Tax=Senna tora TaxID=362788 RepID=A0A834T101_9FABA|nr:serine/arginine repetitive matrix protein 1 [Senna tora]